MGDNREFEAFRHILSCYTHYSWLIVLDISSSLFVLGYLWLPLATTDLVGDNREIEVFRHILIAVIPIVG